MKGILLALAIFVFTIPEFAIAQKGSNHLKISAGVEVPIGIFKEGYQTGWGFYATDYLGVDSKGSFLFSTGIARWNGQNSSFQVGLLFLKTGYRLFFGDNLYLQVEGGLAKGLKDWNNGTSFTYGGGLGYLIKIGNGGVDLSAKFNRIGYRSGLSFLAGYQFELSKSK